MWVVGAANRLLEAIDALVDGSRPRREVDNAEAVLRAWADDSYLNPAGTKSLISVVEGFAMGATPIGVLLEIVVFPPLKLARFLNKGTAQAHITQDLQSSLKVARSVCFKWGRVMLIALGHLGSGSFVSPAAGHAKLLKALFDAKLPEVRKCCHCCVSS